MRPSSAQTDNFANAASGLDLEFPVDPGFESKLNPISPDSLFRMNQWLVESRDARPGFEEQRLRDKCNVEFVL
jgi:hypothetical protein